MKSNDFIKRKRIEVALNDSKNTQPVPKQTNWDRIVYLLVLLIIVIFLCFWAFKNYLTVQGYGYITSPTLHLRAPDGLKITQLYVNKGMRVKKGDSLFGLVVADNNRSVNLQLDLQRQQIDNSGDLNQFKNKIIILRAKLSGLEQKLNYYQKAYITTKQKVKLNITTVQSLIKIEQEKLDLKTKIEETKAELRALNQKIGNQQNATKAYTDLYQNQLESGNKLLKSPFVSPVSGTITDLYALPNQMVFGAELIMNIKLDQAMPYIIAKFNKKDAEYLVPGKIFTVQFHDKTESQAVIADFYTGEATYNNTWKKWINVQSSDEFIVVQLKPLTADMAEIWNKHRGIGVQLIYYIL